MSLLDTLTDESAPDPAAVMDQTDLKDRVADAIARLPEREKLVVALYYYENLTLREIGEVLGVTESRVSQLHTKAVLRLRGAPRRLMTRRPPRVVHLDEIEAIPGPGTLTWHPVRAELGLRAFGTNAYTAQNVGDDVVEPHDENPDLAHEELYFVARGARRSRSTASASTRRRGRTSSCPTPRPTATPWREEPGTTVLSFGGPATFTPSAWEWMFRAVALIDSDVAGARAVLEDGLEKHPESPGLRDRAGARAAGRGRRGRCARDPSRSRRGPPDAEEYARQDAALSALL